MNEVKRFGDYAVDQGFCSPDDVNRALQIQQDLITRGYPHMPIGLIMVRYGLLDNQQLIQVLKQLERDRVACLVDE